MPKHLAHRFKLVFLAVITICLIASQLIGATAQTANSQTGTSQDAASFNQQQALDELKKQIAGKENEPAEKVFKNLQMLKSVPAGRLLAIMEMGYSRSLGVNCTHCHIAGQWDSEEKPAKQITREMAAMTQTINNDLLKKIRNLKSERPTVNCTTCHRGQVKPATNLK